MGPRARGCLKPLKPKRERPKASETLRPELPPPFYIPKTAAGKKELRLLKLRFGLLVAAVGHDLGHPGVNNPFLVEPGPEVRFGSSSGPGALRLFFFNLRGLVVECTSWVPRTRHEVAVTYNDRSPLENMHCAKLFQILRQPETNVFMALDKAFTTDHRACTVLLRQSCRDIVVFRRHCYSCHSDAIVLCYYDRIRVPEVIGVACFFRRSETGASRGVSTTSSMRTSGLLGSETVLVLLLRVGRFFFFFRRFPPRIRCFYRCSRVAPTGDLQGAAKGPDRGQGTLLSRCEDVFLVSLSTDRRSSTPM